MKKYFPLLLFVCCFCFAHSQPVKVFLKDTFEKPGYYRSTYNGVFVKTDNSIITAMWLFDDYAFKNSIQRIDTNGNTLWKFTDTTIIFTSGGDSYSRLILEGSDLYAFGDHYIYKLNALDGTLIWRSAYYSNSSINVPAITRAFNYNSNNLLFIYDKASSLNSIYIVRMDKSTGNMVDSVELYGYLPDVRVAPDTSGNIFISTLDGYYKKLSAQNMHTIIFTDTVVSVNNSPANQITHLYVDSSNQLFTFAIISNGIQINKRDPYNGDTIWQQTLPFNYTNPYLNLAFHELKDVNGFLYVAYEQGGTGSGYWPLAVQKINKANGNVAWLSLIEPSGFDDEYDESSILSMDMDSHGDVYLSAYSGTGNYEGQFDVIKIDGLTGNQIFNNKIDLDSIPDRLSSGNTMAVINDVPYAVGLLETNDKIDLTSPVVRSTVGFAKLNPATGSVILLKLFAGQSMYNARTVAIKKYTNNSLVALYQLGWDIAVAMYDVNLNNIWTRYLSYGDKLYGTDFCIQNEKIYVATYHSHAFFSLQSAKFGYYTLDMQGNLLSDTLFPVSTTTSSNVPDTSYTLKIYADSSNVYFSSYQSNIVPVANKMHRSHNGLFAPPFNLYMGQYTTIDPISLIDFDSTRIMGLGTTGPNTHHYKVASMTKAALDTAFYPLPNLTNTIFFNLFKVSSTRVLIGTRTTFINPIRENAGLLLYDLVTKDTIWSNLSDPDPMTNTATFVKAQTDNDSSIYAITTSGEKAEVKKISLATGQTQWVNVFQDTVNNTKYQFFDADYNPYYQKYIAAGQRKNISGTDTLADVFVVTVNKSGDVIDSFCLPGIKSKANIATKVLQMGQAGNFVSGSYEDSKGIQQAFIMRIGNTVFASDSIWPGDTNQDGIVDYNDLFPIGIAYSNSGPVRLNPSINWQPQYCNNWSDTLPIGINQKFVDCDGDGIITALDTTAIIQNFNLTHERSTLENPVVPGLPYLYIHFASDTLLPGQHVVADIMLGDSVLPATNVYALAFKLSYNSPLIDVGTFAYNFIDSWLGDLQNTITLSQTSNQSVHIARTNTDKQNKSGYGKIGEILFTVKDSVPVDFTTSLIAISELTAVNVDMNYISINTGEGKFVVDNHVVTGSNNIDFDGMCFLYPNPAHTILHIYTENNLPDYVNIFDISGKLLLSKFMHNHIDVSLLQPGLYIAEVTVSGVVHRNRFIKQ